MYGDTKYIVIENKGMEEPILFHFSINHNAVLVRGKQISAGFCQIDMETGEVCVFGKSVTLKLESRPEDAEIIKQMLNGWKRDY